MKGSMAGMAQDVDPYRTQSRWSDPGRWALQLAKLPGDPESVARVVSGLVLDPFLARRRGVDVPASALDDDWQGRTVEAILDRLLARDASALVAARVPGARFFGCCRHYAVLATAVFRAHGVPARARVGFAAYFTPGFLEDHWVCEYRDGERWRLLDASLDDGAVADFAVAFPPSDVPRDQFIDASTAWSRVRAGQLDPATTGLSEIGLAGAWFVANNVLRDVAALNKEEMLPFDFWSLARDIAPRAVGAPAGDVPPDRARDLDDIARMLRGAPGAHDAARVYREHAWVRVTPTLLTIRNGSPVEVAVS